MRQLTGFSLLFVMGTLVGSMFGMLVGFNPTQLSASTYIEQQQVAIRALNTLMPAMGGACIVLLIVQSVLVRARPVAVAQLACSMILMVTAGLITRFENQPINAIVLTWSAVAPASDWAELRDTWWHWHIARTLCAIAAYAIALGTLLGSANDAPTAMRR